MTNVQEILRAAAALLRIGFFTRAHATRPSPIGALLDDNFHRYISDDITLNPSAHDGAIMIARKITYDAYKITGWSFRLFAPNCGGCSPANRGSTFNSCFAIAQEGGIGRVYLYFIRSNVSVYQRGE